MTKQDYMESKGLKIYGHNLLEEVDYEIQDVIEECEDVEKIKVTSLEIIVTGTKDKPYFEIKYKEVGKEDYSIGYSSYDLNNVFRWKEECFEIVNELAEEYKGGWIACSERLPEPEKVVLTCDKDCWISVNINTPYNGKKNDFECGYYVAWMPLPEPYKPEGEQP